MVEIVTHHGLAAALWCRATPHGQHTVEPAAGFAGGEDDEVAGLLQQNLPAQDRAGRAAARNVKVSAGKVHPGPAQKKHGLEGAGLARVAVLTQHMASDADRSMQQ